jgi:hypothetical protein
MGVGIGLWISQGFFFPSQQRLVKCECSGGKEAEIWRLNGICRRRGRGDVSTRLRRLILPVTSHGISIIEQRTDIH